MAQLTCRQLAEARPTRINAIRKERYGRDQVVRSSVGTPREIERRVLTEAIWTLQMALTSILDS